MKHLNNELNACFLFFIIVLCFLSSVYSGKNMVRNLKKQKLKPSFTVIPGTKLTIPLLPKVDYFSATVSHCNNKICKKSNGKCTTPTVCTCEKGKANFPIITDEIICGYNQRKQLIAFLLELCFACGIGHFYIGAWWFGMVKLLVVVLIPIFFCSMMVCSDIFIKGYKLMIILFSITGGLYWLSDIILFISIVMGMVFL